LSSLAYGFVKDITKAAAKAYLDQREQKAWVAYFEAESMSDAYLPIWMMASDQYWTSYDAFQGLEAKKAELLAGYEPSTMTRVTLDKSFPSGSGLTVTLTVARPPGATLPLSLVVSVAGRPAGGPGPGSTYTVSSKNLLQGKSGLGVSIEAR
jgi:hypothetical protein